MKITMERTPSVTEVDGVPCRVWQGVTEDGTPVTVLVHRLAVPLDVPQEQRAQFERQFESAMPPKTMVLMESAPASFDVSRN